MSTIPALSLGALLILIVTAGVLRGPLFAVFGALAGGTYTCAVLTILPLVRATRLEPLFLSLHVIAYLHLFLFLALPGMRGPTYRALVSLPGSYFVAGTLLALPWGVLAQLGATGPLFIASLWLPYLLAAFGLLQSLSARRDDVHIVLDGSDAGPLARHRADPAGPARAARPLRVAQISDPHLGPFMSVERLQRICRDIVAADPDLVLLTGDFLTVDSQQSGEHLTRALAPLRPLAGRTFACRGNHDLEAPAFVAAALAANGVHLLIDDAVTARTPYGEVELLGFDYVFRQRAAHVAAVAARHPRRDASIPRLALLHDPGCFRHVPEGTADLVFSGHLHGGQLGLFLAAGGWTVPRLLSLPDHGLWARGRDRIYVHRGNAHYGFPLRIGVPAEESILHLHLVAPRDAR